MLIGLTGSVATGKTTAAKLFKELGCYVINADELAHAAYKPHSKAYKKIVEAFSENILKEDGTIDREKLRKIVLNDKDKLRLLESIVHPEVERLRKETISQITKKDRDAIIVYEVPLLFEKNLQDLFDYTVVVYASADQQIERLTGQRNMDRKEAEKLINLQMPISEKAKLADFVLYNTSSPEKLKPQVEEILRKIRTKRMG